MAKSILTPLNMNSLEILNLRLQNLITASHPSEVAGEVFYDITLDRLAVCNNAGSFVAVGSTVITDLTGTLLVAHGGTGVDTMTTAFGTICAGTTATGAVQTVAPGTTGWFLKSAGVAALPAYAALAAADMSDFNSTVQGNRLDQMATPTSSVAMGAQKITGLLNPTDAQDAVTKTYVDGLASGISIHVACRAATTVPITLSAPQTIDTTVVLIAGNRVLVKNQADATTNGIYVVAAAGWTRAADFDASVEIASGAFVFIEEGTVNDNTGWVLTTANPITLGTSELAFTQFSAAVPLTAGAGMTQTGTAFNVITAALSGITVEADAISIDTAVVVRKYAVSIGNGTLTTIPVTHNLGTKDITYSVRMVADDTMVDCDVVSTSTTVANFTFAVAPATDTIRVTIHG